MRSRLCSLGLTLSIATAPAAAGATSYYVAPSGNADSSGTDRAAPTTTESALGAAMAGDMIVFLDGQYAAPLSLTKSGNPGAPITLIADEGATPILLGPEGNNADGLSAAVNVSHYVIDGLWFENWRYGGVGLDWIEDVSDIVIRNCVADFNQLNGFALYRVPNVTVEYSIASRNGYGPSSWSSNFNLWGIKGTNNVIRGNVSFHGIDTSEGQSDGNGFILDLTLDAGGALFENNIAFLNGGSCISVTDSGGAVLLNNTCFHNAQLAASYMDELNVGDTCRGLVDGIDIASKPWSFSGMVVKNNAIVAKSGKDGLNTYTCGGGTVAYEDTNNHVEQSDGSALFADPAAASFAPLAGSALVELGVSTDSVTDVGFDPKCIKLETDQAKKLYEYWTHAPDKDYIQSIGGIAKCFAPKLRPQGSGMDIGAYELGDAPASGGSGGSGVAGGGGTPPGMGEGGSGSSADGGGAAAGFAPGNAGSTPAASAGSPASAGADTRGSSSTGNGGCACALPGTPPAPSWPGIALAALLLSSLRRRARP